MKRIIFLLALATTLTGNLSAQDTLWRQPAPLDNYYSDNWFDTSDERIIDVKACHTAFSSVMARRYISTDTLQIYGIAAMMRKSEASNPNYLTDTTWEQVEESLLLFQYHENGSPVMQQIGDSLKVHALYTPVCYWMMWDLRLPPYYDSYPNPAKAVYERYFSTPQTVYDTFYAGFTLNEGGWSKEDSLWHEWRHALGCDCFHPASHSVRYFYDEEVAALIQDSLNAPLEWEFRPFRCSYFLFPILTPAPPIDTTVTPIDTTVIPVDTTVTPIDTTTAGVSRVDMVGRYVSVSPNPAGDRATVLSSFGLTAIEAYDPQGRQLYAAPATGLRTTLDVSAWPRGTALLHIHTPAGTTVKKLLLR